MSDRIKANLMVVGESITNPVVLGIAIGFMLPKVLGYL